MMQTTRNLPSQNPISINEVLDLFEAYVSTIGKPLTKATHLISDELGYREGDIFAHITGVVSDSHQMANRLKQIRSARNAGSDVNITVSREDATRAEKSLDEVQSLLSEAAAVFGLLRNGIGAGYFTGDDYGAMSVMSLAQRAFLNAENQEGTVLSHLASKLREAGTDRHIDQEEAA